jgi:HlyD family secretion protein
MDKPKDLVPRDESDQPNKLDSTNRTNSAGRQPQFKRAGKIAQTDSEQTDNLSNEAGDGSANAALARSIPPRPRPRTPVRQRRRNGLWGWLVVGVVAIAAGVGTFFYVRNTQTSTAFQGQTTTASTRLPVSVSLSASGQIQANADLSLTFGSSGTIIKLNKALGNSVQSGEVLAQIDDSNLQFALKSAQASYDQQLASYNTTIAGATQKDLEVAQAQVDAARANLDKTINGTSTPQDITAAQAAIKSAQTKLAEDQQGGQPYDIASAASAVSSAQAQLASAKANLAKVLTGSDNATLVSAQAAYDQAVANYDKTLSSLKLAVTNAQVAHDQALNALKNAQDAYQAVYTNNRNADGTLKANLPQSNINNETTAYRSLQDAQGSFNKADAALNDAKVALNDQSRSLQSQVDNAKAQLDKVKAGPTQADAAAAQASVASAQSSVDSALKAQAALTPTQSQIASDQAALASAQASLAKLAGGTPDDIASAEATLRENQATLDDLKNGPQPNDIAIAKAQLAVSQSNLDKAKADLANDVIKAPFTGIVVQAPTTVGQTAAADTVIYEIVDLSSLHVDANVGESDIAKIKEGTPVAVNLDGIPNRSFTGKVTFISSKATVTSNVTSYLTTVTLDSGSTNSLLAAYPNEFSRLLQGRQGQGNATGGNRAAAGGSTGVASAALAASSGICGYVPSSQSSNTISTEQTTPKPGMTANVTFCLNLKGGVLSVPNRAIQTKTENGQRVSYVNVLVNAETGEIEQRAVLTGLAGDNYTEITGGNLKEGDQIVLSSVPTNRVTTTNPNRPGG